jgi:TRAP-type mannitol/chloroaromatic compound transport system substrate-binding protein
LASQSPRFWRYPESPPSRSVLPVFVERVEKASGGRLKIDALPAGTIVPAFEVVDATNRGVIDGAYTCTYYYIGKHKAAAAPYSPCIGDTSCGASR